MLLVLLGPPGAGKGTQAELICKNHNFFHFSTGNILRDEINNETAIGKKIKKIINQGKLVSDNIILKIIDNIITKELSANKGVLLDGFPRNLSQALALNSLLEKKKHSIVCAIHITIDKKEILKRIKKRRQIEGRQDDDINILKSRLNVYIKETKPLIKLYKKEGKISVVNGMQTIDNVNKDINKIILNI
tara:strand:- start:2267 stop:2836 length:570 start_codon:yes stop_codon:yes gene_type:complete